MTRGIQKLSNKLTSFINTRKPIINVDRHRANYRNNGILQEFLWVQSKSCTPVKKDGTIGKLVQIQEPSSRSCFQQTILEGYQNNKNITKRNDLFNKNSTWAATKWNRSFLLPNNSSCGAVLLNCSLRASFINEKAIARYSTSLGNNPQFNSENKPVRPTNGPKGLPSQDQLQNVFNRLADNLPKLYFQTIDYSVFAGDVIIHDNVKGATERGIAKLVRKIAWMRIKGHTKYAYVKFNILKMTSHPEDGSVKVRWRIKGLTTMSVVLNFWKIKPWDLKHSLMNIEHLFKWEDGLYTFYVNEEGKIHTCIIDNIIPDDKDKISKVETKLREKVSAKLAAPAPPPTSGSTSITETKS